MMLFTLTMAETDEHLLFRFSSFSLLRMRALCDLANVLRSDNTNNGMVKTAHQRENTAFCSCAGNAQTQHSLYGYRSHSEAGIYSHSAFQGCRYLRTQADWVQELSGEIIAFFIKKNFFSSEDAFVESIDTNLHNKTICNAQEILQISLKALLKDIWGNTLRSWCLLYRSVNETRSSESVNNLWLHNSDVTPFVLTGHYCSVALSWSKLLVRVLNNSHSHSVLSSGHRPSHPDRKKH